MFRGLKPGLYSWKGREGYVRQNSESDDFTEDAIILHKRYKY